MSCNFFNYFQYFNFYLLNKQKDVNEVFYLTFLDSVVVWFIFETIGIKISKNYIFLVHQRKAVNLIKIRKLSSAQDFSKGETLNCRQNSILILLLGGTFMDLSSLIYLWPSYFERNFENKKNYGKEKNFGTSSFETSIGIEFLIYFNILTNLQKTYLSF